MSSLLATTEIDNSEITNSANAGAPAGVEEGATQQVAGSGNSGGINWEKRYKDLQSYHDREKARLSQELKQAQDSVSLSSPEDVEKFKKEHPETFKMMLTLARQEVMSVTPKAEEPKAPSSAEKAREKIKEAHPDFASIVNSQGFRAWAAGQTAEVQRWIYNNPDNASLAIAALDMYKAQAGSKNDSSSKGSAADAVASGSSPDIKSEKIWKASEIKKLTPQQYAKYEEAIDKAWADGRVDMNS